MARMVPPETQEDVQKLAQDLERERVLDLPKAQALGLAYILKNKMARLKERAQTRLKDVRRKLEQTERRR